MFSVKLQLCLSVVVRLRPIAFRHRHRALIVRPMVDAIGQLVRSLSHFVRPKISCHVMRPCEVFIVLG